MDARARSVLAALLLGVALAGPASLTPALAPSASSAAPAALASSAPSVTLARSAGVIAERTPPFFACPPDIGPSGSFADTGAGAVADAADCLAWYGITQGVAPGEFDPDGEVTRAQMAAFVHRSIRYTLGLYERDLPAWDGSSVFPDVPATVGAAEAINVLSSDAAVEAFGHRIVTGTPEGTYQPGAPVTREQMGTVLARSLRGIFTYLDTEFPDAGFELRPGECGETFPDRSTISAVHDANIDLICSGGIATGRDDGTFDPRAAITRGQVAALLLRTQDVLVEFGASLPPPP